MKMVSHVSKIDLENFVANVFQAAGIEQKHSEIVAKHLVLANLRGVDSHGVTRVNNYIQRLESGVVNKNHEMIIIKETASSALIDGANELGIIVATEGIRIAVEKAKEVGISVVGIKNSNHCGMLADYTNYAVENDCIAFATTNAPSNMAPWGGKERYFGTNPISYGVPGGSVGNIIFDMATSVVARGKIKLAVKNNQDIPLGWALTKEGESTTDANAAMDGIVLPVGGPKGYGLAFFAEVLSGLFTGAGLAANLGRPEDLTTPQNLGQFFFVMRADLFEELDTFKQRMELMAEEIKQVPLAKGFEKIFLPGELEAIKARENEQNGIPLTSEVLMELRMVGERYGVSRL